jgi:hypothetical protein
LKALATAAEMVPRKIASLALPENVLPEMVPLAASSDMSAPAVAVPVKVLLMKLTLVDAV